MKYQEAGNRKTERVLKNRHQERSGSTSLEEPQPLIERDVAGTFFWLLFFGAKEK